MYSNTAGRRDMYAIPGNANLIAKDSVANMAGYNRYVMNSVGGTVQSTQQFLKQASDQGRTEEELENAAREANGGMFVSSMVGGVGATSANEPVRLERDAYAARDTVTFSEPTGLSLERQKMNQIVRFILLALTIAAIAVIVITVSMVVKKTKYDDKNIIDSNKN